MGLLMILSGPSGSGKTTLANQLAQLPSTAIDAMFYASGSCFHTSTIKRVTTCTTRPQRRDENVTDYYFMSAEKFTAHQEHNTFVESTQYGGHRYGTLRRDVERIIYSTQDGVIVLDQQGAKKVRSEYFVNTCAVYVLPPNIEAIKARLGARDPEEAQQRLAFVGQELINYGESSFYDHAVVNEDLIDTLTNLFYIFEYRRRKMQELIVQGNDLQKYTAIALQNLIRQTT